MLCTTTWWAPRTKGQFPIWNLGFRNLQPPGCRAKFLPSCHRGMPSAPKWSHSSCFNSPHLSSPLGAHTALRNTSGSQHPQPKWSVVSQMNWEWGNLVPALVLPGTAPKTRSGEWTGPHTATVHRPAGCLWCPSGPSLHQHTFSSQKFSQVLRSKNEARRSACRHPWFISWALQFSVNSGPHAPKAWADISLQLWKILKACWGNNSALRAGLGVSCSPQETQAWHPVCQNAPALLKVSFQSQHLLHLHTNDFWTF